MIPKPVDTYSNNIREITSHLSTPMDPSYSNFAEHWDKIIFKIIKDPSGKIPTKLLKTELDIKVFDNTNQLGDLKQKIRDFFVRSRYWFVNDGVQTPVVVIDPTMESFHTLTEMESKNLVIEIIDVKYSTMFVSSLIHIDESTKIESSS